MEVVYILNILKLDDKKLASIGSERGLITNVAEVPYDNPTYDYINSIGRQWIFQVLTCFS